MKAKSSSKSKKVYCFKVLNKKNKFLEGVFPFSKEGKIQALKFVNVSEQNLKIVKSKV
jgi:hypothetical protein